MPEPGPGDDFDRRLYRLPKPTLTRPTSYRDAHTLATDLFKALRAAQNALNVAHHELSKLKGARNGRKAT